MEGSKFHTTKCIDCLKKKQKLFASRLTIGLPQCYLTLYLI